MKKIFILLTCAALYGCNNGTRQHQTADSANKDTTLKSLKSEKKFTLEDQKTVYKGVNFGINKKAYKKTITERSQTIGEYTYLVDPAFNEKDELYTLYINSPSQDASYLDNEVHLKMNNLVDVIVKKYGEPTTTDQYPPIYNMEPGYIRWVDTWNIGTKNIKIGIGEDYDSPRYYAVCEISDVPMTIAYESQQNKKVDKNKQKNANDF